MSYSHECGGFYADPYPSATPAMSLEMQRLDREIAAWLAAHPGATETDYWDDEDPTNNDPTDYCGCCGATFPSVEAVIEHVRSCCEKRLGAQS
jgi:hypothetical protein